MNSAFLDSSIGIGIGIISFLAGSQSHGAGNLTRCLDAVNELAQGSIRLPRGFEETQHR